MKPEETAFLDARALVRGYMERAFSPLEVTEAALARIGRLDPALNAFQHVDSKGALMAAKAADARWLSGQPCGPLDGVPLTVKDLTMVKGLPMRRGSLTTGEDPCAEDAPCVARLRAAGAVILGKTTTPEFGWKGMTDGPLFGITRNPWDLARTPGGSSGGAAAALAAGIGALAHGTDGGGSIRIPASYCGLYGIKPTFGRVPHHPMEGAFCTIASQGPIARSVADAAAMLTVMAQPDPRDWYALPADQRSYAEELGEGVAGLRLAYCPSLGGAEPESRVLAPVEAAVGLLRDLGAEVEEVGPLFPPLRPDFERYWLAGFATLIRDLPAVALDSLDPRLRPLAEAGLDVSLADYDRAMKARAALGRSMNGLHETYAALITPTMPTPPPAAETPYHSAEFDRWRDATPYTVPFNLTGQPAASIPCGVTADGLPVGLQLVGPLYGDAMVLRISAALEAALDLPRPHPALLASLEAISKPD